VANLSISDLQRIRDIVPTLDSFILSTHLFIGERTSITWFQSPTSYSAPLLTLLQTDTMLSGNPCNFYILSLNNCADLFTDIPLVVAVKYAILDNLLHTTKIIFFPVTNGNLVIKSTIICV